MAEASSTNQMNRDGSTVWLNRTTRGSNDNPDILRWASAHFHNVDPEKFSPMAMQLSDGVAVRVSTDFTLHLTNEQFEQLQAVRLPVVREATESAI